MNYTFLIGLLQVLLLLRVPPPPLILLLLLLLILILILIIILLPLLLLLLLTTCLPPKVLDALSQPIDEVAFATLYKISIVVVARTVLAITLGSELRLLEDALAQEQAAGVAR